jgi:hypothetical protein
VELLCARGYNSEHHPTVARRCPPPICARSRCPLLACRTRGLAVLRARSLQYRHGAATRAMRGGLDSGHTGRAAVYPRVSCTSLLELESLSDAVPHTAPPLRWPCMIDSMINAGVRCAIGRVAQTAVATSGCN